MGKYQFVDKTHSRRLQGRFWHENKHLYNIIGYFISNHDNVCIFLRSVSDRNNSSDILWHWMNPDETDEFYKIKDNYPLMDFNKVKSNRNRETAQ